MRSCARRLRSLTTWSRASSRSRGRTPLRESGSNSAYTVASQLPQRILTSVTSPTRTPRNITGAPFWRPVTAESKYRVVMYFDSAVTGLQKGAPVMLRGVRVGEVTDVSMRWGNWLATVYAEFEPDCLKGGRS